MQYYVSSSYTGPISNGGITTPWKTLNQVASANLQPGDIVSFKRNDTFSGTLNISRSGTAGNPIIFNDYGNGNFPRFIGTGSTINSLFYINNRSYLTFEGLDITDVTLSPTDRSQDAKIQRVFYLDGSSNNIKIDGCIMTLIGVGAYFVGPSNTMNGCNIGNLRMVVDTNQGYQPGNDDDYGANPLVISSSNNTITNNYFYDCYADSYDYTVDGGGIELYNRNGPMNNNLIAYNTFKNTGGIFEITGNTTDNLFIYNKVINVGAVVYVQSGYTTTNFRFYNNTFIENATPNIPDDIGGRLFGGNIGANCIILKNNVFQLSNGTRVGTDSDIVHEYNIYKVSGSSSVGYSLHASELSTSAVLFQNTTGNPENWDYTPISGSPLINFGTPLSLTQDFNKQPLNGNPDAGCIENQNGQPDPIPDYVRNGVIKVMSKNYTTYLDTADGSLTIRFTGTNTPWTAQINNSTPVQSGIPGYPNRVKFDNLRRGSYVIVITDVAGLKYTANTTVASRNKTNSP